MVEYTTRNGHTFRGQEGTERTVEALALLEGGKVDLADGLSWLTANRYANPDQPESHDEALIRLDDGLDVQWNYDRGQWEPGAWVYP